MGTFVRSIFDQPDAASVTAQFDRVVAAFEEKPPDAARHLEDVRTC